MSSGVRLDDDALDPVSHASDDAVTTACSHPRRSAVCAVLLERDDVVSVERLATLVAARGADESPDDVGESLRRDVHISLSHNHLPKLDDVDVVVWSREHDRVTLSLAPDRLAAELESESESSSYAGRSVTDRSRTRRERLRSLLADCDGAVTVRALAARLVAAERGVSPDDVSASEAESVHIRLRHVHLPAMAESDVLEYDPAAGEVSDTEQPPRSGW
ncbi:DUF7344 domain-containing protein [Natrialbaceae archaeon AArc-T1-2]|uniref:DUF7344 domain-containing protein n=1 Tax=Natrialbaceae archaeon AArc-T1-2 TaxID=3053904 RepID=UPI00255A82C2|nr:hypothetical protein [Natrialbaceae archaeon AArc-T1-2]WIV66800.1 hypothetical protein QQ977_14060 [Natrialbaceae archaeon AArc-T1-2]